MASPRSAWGIDIGNRALKAVKLIRDGDAIRVDDFDFIEHETILSQAGDNKDDLIRQALATFVGHKNTKGSAVAVGVSGQTSFARFIKLPPVEAKQIPQIVQFEAIQQIPFPLDEVEWAYQLFQSPDTPDIECGIFAMRKELVNQWVGMFTQHDLNVQAVQTNPLATYNAVQRDGRLHDGTAMIIDVGAENTDLIIAGDNSIWMRSIPIGGNSFTETIQKAFKLNPRKAEELKREAAGSKYYRQILQAMRPVFADLVAEIQRSIGFYGSVNRENKINKIIAMGGTFRMPSLPKYLQQNLQLDVERPDNFAAGLPDDSKVAAALTENVLSLHSAYGLALQAMGETKVDSSLLPTVIRKRKMWQEKNKWFGIAAGLCVAGALVGLASYIFSSSAHSGGKEDRAKIGDIVSRATHLSNDWTEIQNGGGTDLTTVTNAVSLAEHRDLWPRIFTDLSGALPPLPPELAAALKAGNADAIKKTPRGERALIQIDSVQSRYYADLTPLLNGGGLARMGSEFQNTNGIIPGAAGTPQPTATPAEGAAVTAPIHGFVVYLRLLSPNRQAETVLVNDQLIARLAAVKADPATGRTFSFVKPEFVQAKLLKDDGELLNRLRADYAGMQSASMLMQTGQAGPGVGAFQVGVAANERPAGSEGSVAGDDVSGPRRPMFPGITRGRVVALPLQAPTLMQTHSKTGSPAKTSVTIRWSTSSSRSC